MNRREFLKGTLGGVFGAFLTWAGVVRGEEATAPSSDVEIVEVNVAPLVGWDWMQRYVDGFDLGLLYSQNGKLSLARLREFRREHYGVGTESEPITSDQAFDAIIESVNKWNDRISDNVSWDYSPDTGDVQVTDFYWCHQGCDGCHHEDCEAYPVVDPWDGIVRSIKINHHGAVWSEIGHGFGRWIHWSVEGSDENGTGTVEDPVATEACARSIAGNPFRV